MQTCHTIKEYSDLFVQTSNNNDYQTVDIADDEWEYLSDNDNSAETILQYFRKTNKVTVTTGIEKQRTVVLDNFESLDISESIGNNRRGHIINTGQSIWGLDFVPQPTPANDNARQSRNKRAKIEADITTEYLAVGGYNSTEEHHSLDEERSAEDQYNAIQIYELSSFTETAKAKSKIRLCMCILHDYGVVVDLKWCPFSIFNENRKLGILVILLNDGSSIVLVVPCPEYVRKKLALSKKVTDKVVHIRVKKPRLTLTMDNSLSGSVTVQKINKYTCFSWGGNKLAYGTMRGDIVVWNMVKSLQQNIPSLHIMIPSSFHLPVRCISWRSHFDPFILFWSDLDGNFIVHDLRDPYVPFRIFRTRQPFARITGPGHGTGFLYADSDQVVRKNVYFNTKKGAAVTVNHGQIWDIAVSPHNDVALTVSANGLALAKAFKKGNDEYSNGNHRYIPQCTIYHLTSVPESNTYIYLDSDEPMNNTPVRNSHDVFFDPLIALQKITWNPNKHASGWIASGGASGFCRVELISEVIKSA